MEFKVQSSAAQEVIDITPKVEQLVKGVKRGLCNVFVKHATAAVIINENWDPKIAEDFLKALNTAIPDHASYKHDEVDDNAGAHIKAAILGPSETVQVSNGKLQLGKWQDIWLVDFDGPRERTVSVETIQEV